MKVLMLGKLGLLASKGGGDKVQITNTAKELKKLGVTVDIQDNFSIDPKKYDVVHIFQLDWTPESNIYAEMVKKAGRRLIFSPIHHNVNEVKRFDDEYAFDFRRLSKWIFQDQFKRDTLKDLYRMFFNLKKAKPVLKSIFKGLKQMHIETLEASDIVLVQTDLEAKDLQDTFNVEFRWRKIPNGVGAPFIYDQDYKNTLGFKNYIICVGRIEPRKNQLKVIEAVNMLRNRDKVDVNLVFIGYNTGVKHLEYTYYFQRQLKNKPWIRHIPRVEYKDMPSYYHYAKVGISASWFETTGLTSLEALFCGANAVASGRRAMEYLGEYASYCDPGDINSIYSALKKEYFMKKPKIPEEMKSLYTWENAAKKTLECYEEVLKQ